MKISELKPKMPGINLEFEVAEKGEIREFNKFGRSGKVCNAVAKDSSGTVKLTLWNEDVDRINVGDKVKLTEGYVGEYQGEMQLTTGRGGKLEVIGKADTTEKETAPSGKPAEKKPAKKDEPKESDEEDDSGESGNDSDFDDVDEEFVE